MTKYIDIHTHFADLTDNETTAIINVSLPHEDIPKDILFSAGFHPWNSGIHSIDTIREKLEEIVVYKNLAAFGECGIDRSTEIPVDKQISEFKIHIEIAAKYGKPLIIHCVKAYSDLLQILKTGIVKTPLIIHNYQGNSTQALQLLKHKCYFSFGESILRERIAIFDSFKHIPVNRIFLETDESNISIRELYKKAAMLLKIDENRLINEISTNLKAAGILLDF